MRFRFEVGNIGWIKAVIDNMNGGKEEFDIPVRILDKRVKVGDSDNVPIYEVTPLVSSRSYTLWANECQLTKDV